MPVAGPPVTQNLAEVTVSSLAVYVRHLKNKSLHFCGRIKMYIIIT